MMRRFAGPPVGDGCSWPEAADRPDGVVLYDASMLNFELTLDDGFILVTLEGLVSLDAWDEVLQRVAVALPPKDAPRRLVIDMRSVLGYLGIPERTAVGNMMASRLNLMEKVVILVQTEKITQIVHDEARKNGLDLRLFPHYDQAVAWVTS
jgi:hypothetical protein